MARLVKRRVALAVAMAAVLAGGTAVALGATGAPHSHRTHLRRAHLHQQAHRAGLLTASSAYLGLSATQLRDELEAGKTLGQIAQATPGKSEAGLVAALLAAVHQRPHSTTAATLPARIQRLVRGRPGRDLAARHGRPGLFAIARSYLGIERWPLLKQLRAGTTLAQIADSTPGKSASGLREAILTALKARLDVKVSAHTLSAAAAKHRLSHLEGKVEALLNRSHTRRAGHALGQPSG